MKNIYPVLGLFLFFSTALRAQNDCCNAEPLFSPLPVTIASSAGNGTFEDLSACSCLATDEHDSYWFSFQCITSGTFEMMITPAGLSADFDFALYGQECPCGNNTTVVSCDYTGPITPPGPFVPSGIASDPMTSFGVPGLTEFQPTVNITAGTVYYLIADNITTNGAGFTIEFAGTATFGPPPVNPPPAPPAPITGDLMTCPNATVTYNVPNDPNLTSYEWSVTPPLGLINTNGNSSVDVTWTAPGSYLLCVEGSTGCETSAPTCVTVEVSPIITVPVEDNICLGGTYTAPDGQVLFGPGVYDMNFTNYQGCDSIVQLILSLVLPSQTILVEEICDGDCITFFGQNICSSGVYEEILTNQYGCDSTVTLSVIVVPNLAIVTGMDTISCLNDTIVLDGGGSIGGTNMTFAWTNTSGQTVGTDTTLIVTAPGDYTLTITSEVGANTCVDDSLVVVPANNAPPGSITAIGGTIDCTNSSVMLAGNSTTPGVTYAWTGPGGYTSTEQNPTVSVTGDYELTVTGPNGCSGMATATVDGDSSLPNATAAGDTLNCTNTSVALSGNSTTPGVAFAWTGPGGFTSNQQNPTVGATGTYTLTVTAANGCSAQATALVAEDVTVPDATAMGDTLDCQNPSLPVTGGSTTPGVSFSWAGPNGFTSNLQSPVVSAPGTYTLTVTAPNGCTATATAEVVQDANVPNVSAAGGLLDCTNPSLDLQGNSTTPGVSFSWAGPNGFTSILQDPTVSDPGTYTLMVTAANGCTATATAEVTQDVAVPDASAVGDTLTCTTGSVTLQGNSTTPGVTFGWSGPGGFTSILQNPTATEAGTYTLTVTAPNGCTATATAEVAQDAGLPDASATGDTLDCNIGSVQILGSSATPGVTFAWAGPGGFTSALPNPTVNMAGNYVLTVTAANSCTAQATAVVYLDDAAPDIQVAGDTLTCAITSVTLGGSSVTAGAVFSWAGPGGFTSSQPNPGVSVAGIYTLTVSGPNGCTATADAVAEEDVAVPDVAAMSGTLDCNNPGILLDGTSATAGVAFSWSGPGGFLAGQEDTLVALSGNYSLTVTAPNGCTATAVTDVLEDFAVPDVGATGGILTCDFPSIALTGNSTTPGVTWSWAGPAGYSSNEQNPVITQTGTYLLTVTGPNGCSASDPATVVEDVNIPGASATGGTLTCAQTDISLAGTSATAGVTYGWAGPGGFTSNGQNPAVTAPGDYVLTVTAANGCTATATATVLEDIAAPDVAATGGTLTCTAGSLTLNGGSATPNVTFGWTGPGGFTSVEQNPAVTAPGTYVLTVTAANGCTATANAVVSEDANAPTATATGGELDCTVTVLNLDGGSNAANVTWSWTGPGGFTSNQEDPAVTVPGDYELTVTAANGCTATATATVAQDIQTPDASATGGLITCQNPTVVLTGSSTTPGVTWAWVGPGGFTADQPNPAVTEGGTYTLTVTAANGCTAAADAVVTLDAGVPEASATGGLLTCIITSVQLAGGSNQPDVTWAWTGPGGYTSSEQNPTVTVSGTYTLTITTTTGCLASANAVVDEDVALPNVVIAAPGQLDCVTESVILDGSGSDGGAGFSFQWTTPDGHFAAGENTLTPEVDAAGVYILQVTNLANGCIAEANEIVLLSTSAPSGATIAVSNPGCFGIDDGVISIEKVEGGTPPYLYSLDGAPFGDANVFTGMAPGVFTLMVMDNTGCQWETQVTLIAPTPIWVSLDAVDLTTALLPLGESVELKAIIPIPVDSLQSMVWLPPEVAVGCETCLTLTATPYETTTYSLTVTGMNGCTATDEVTVPVDKTRPVYVPNAFSPNNDGINDFVTVYGGLPVTNVKAFLVFNRWGETVYEFHNFEPNLPAKGWDGRFRGKMMDTGVFTWFAEVEFVDGESLIFKGDVTLLK
jgi:gliding motility-associated-like protein